MSRIRTFNFCCFLGLFLSASISAADVAVRVDPSRASEWTVDKRIFGRFFEPNGKDAYPGLYAQHVANNSFEPWFDDGVNERQELLYPVEKSRRVAFPWEPAVPLDGPRFERPHFRLLPGGTNGEWFQRLQVESEMYPAGVMQRLALPDERTLIYNLSISVRGQATEPSVLVRLEGVSGFAGAELRIPIERQWKRHHVTLTIPEREPTRYRGSPFGEYRLVILLNGTGWADLDNVMLMSGDAVKGKYNPTTVRLLKEFHVTSMRWPGGNWASVYHWRDGVGPLEARPIRPNLAWGGLEPNHLGTNEFLEFCRLTGMEPLLNVGFNPDISPAEAAQWVEYVNGSAETPMGKLRAQHGYPEPWGVRLWQVGNEVTGPWQIGHTTAEDYAKGFQAYYEAMKAADPSITILADGFDPAAERPSKGESWKETLFRVGGKRVEGVDIHHYVRGVSDPAARRQWTAAEHNQAMVAFPAYFELLLREIKDSAAKYGLPNVMISVGEWNLNGIAHSHWPDQEAYPTLAHASFVAGMYHSFIRQGDAVRFSYPRDNTLYFRPYPFDLRPVNPGAYVLKLYSEPFASGSQYKHLPVEVEGPTFTLRRSGSIVREVKNVPKIDAAGLVAESGDEVIVLLTNRDTTHTHEVRVEVSGGFQPDAAVEINTIAANDPFAQQQSWDRPEAFRVKRLASRLGPNRQVTVSMPPCSVVRLRIANRPGE